MFLEEGYVPGRRDEARVEAQLQALGQGRGIATTAPLSPGPPGGKPVMSQVELDALERAEIQLAIEASQQSLDIEQSHSR